MPLDGQVYLHDLQYAGRHFVARLQLCHLVLETGVERSLACLELTLRLVELLVQGVDRHANLEPIVFRQRGQVRRVDGVAPRFPRGARHRVAAQGALQPLVGCRLDNTVFVVEVLPDLGEFFPFEIHRPPILLDTVARQDANVDDRARDSGGHS